MNFWACRRSTTCIAWWMGMRTAPHTTNPTYSIPSATSTVTRAFFATWSRTAHVDPPTTRRYLCMYIADRSVALQSGSDFRSAKQPKSWGVIISDQPLRFADAGLREKWVKKDSQEGWARDSQSARDSGGIHTYMQENISSRHYWVGPRRRRVVIECLAKRFPLPCTRTGSVEPASVIGIPRKGERCRKLEAHEAWRSEVCQGGLQHTRSADDLGAPFIHDYHPWMDFYGPWTKPKSQKADFKKVKLIWWKGSGLWTYNMKQPQTHLSQAFHMSLGFHCD